MKKVIIKCFYKIKFSIFACNFFGKILFICVLYGGCVNRRKTYILYKNNIRL